MQVDIAVTTEQIRQIGTRSRTKLGSGPGMSSAEADAFLLVHGGQLQSKLLQTIVEFVQKKLEE